MKKISTLFIVLCVTVAVNAQGFKDHYFSSIGFSPFLEFGASPGVYAPANKDANTGAQYYLGYQSKWMFAPAFSYEGRYNLTEPSENMAISVKSTPTLSGIANQGIFGFYIPIGVGLEMGNGATYQTSANTGFTFTVGYSLNMAPLFPIGDLKDQADTYSADLKTTWGCPYVAAGIRYWNKKNKLREISIRYGFGPSADSKPNGALIENSVTDDFSSAYFLRVSWMKYINY